MAEPVLAGPGGLEEAGVTPGGEQVREVTGGDAGQLAQDVPAEAGAQDGSGLDDRTGGLGQFGQPRAGDDPDGVGNRRADRVCARVLAGELTGQFGGQERVAAAALGDDADQVGRWWRPGHPGYQAGHIVLGERRQRDHQAGSQQRVALVQPAPPGLVAVARGDQHDRGHGPQGGGQLGQQPQRRRIRLVRVVDDHQHRPRCGRDDLGQVEGQLGARAPGVGRAARWGAVGVAGPACHRGQKRRPVHQPGRGRMAVREHAHHPRPRAQRSAARGGRAPRPDDLEGPGRVGPRPVSGRLGQPGLADAGLAGHRHQGAPPGPRASQHRVDLGERPDARHERVQHPDDHPSAILPVWQNVRLPQ